jgi:hypothetical protein
MAHDAFISYASEDQTIADKIRTSLAASGLKSWMAPYDITPGQSYAAAITGAIKESRVFILIFSAHANESEHVPREVERAVHLGIPIVPVRIEQVAPSSSMEHFIAMVQWLDTSKPPQKQELDRLSEVVRKWRDAPAKPKEGRSVPSPEIIKSGSPPLRIALLYKRNSQPDEQVLQFLEKTFTANGYDVFVDRHLGIGVEWAKELDRRIREADAVIPLLTARSVQSEMFAGELQIAHDEAHNRDGKPRILPIRLNFEGELPPEIAGFLNRLQYFLWTGPQDNERLASEVANALQAPKAPPVTGPPPTGVLPLDSRYYIERPSDKEFLAAIQRQDSVIRVRGARQVGKTSLLARGIEMARAKGTRVIITDFQQLNAADLASVETLFRTLGEWIADELRLDIALDQLSNPRRNLSRRFNSFICQEIMGRISEPLVWVMDEVDRLFPCPFRSEVFGLFRSWHNARAMEPTQPWKRLTLVIAYATEAHLLIDNLDQSPFNVGTSLSLADFNLDQLAELNRRYGAPLKSDQELQGYFGLIGGHPYLSNRGLYEMVSKGMGLAEFQKHAESEDGVFGDHLRRLLVILAKDAELCEIVKTVLRGRPSASSEGFLRLRSAGVLAGDSVQDARPRCQLYASYLGSHLQ